MSARLPTTDIYFAHACHDWIGRWWTRRPIRALGANCFVAGDIMALIRRDEDAVMRRALDWPGRLVYLIDDDIAGAADSPELPDDYRRRLGQFDRQFHQALLERADTLLVSSPALAALFAANPRITARIREVFPYWPMDAADTRHFAGLERGEALRIVHLGSGSHAGAFVALAPAITQVLDGPDNVHFTYFGREAPGPLPAVHPRATRIAPMRWPTYRRWLARQRFHLALYPLDATRFDAARSANKIVEHGVAGAVGVYPESWPLAQMVAGGSLAAPSDPADWAAVLKDAIGRRGQLAGLAQRAAQALAAGPGRAAQRALWSDVLDLPPA